MTVIRQFHGKLMEGSVDIPWKIHGRFHGFSMEPSLYFPGFPCNVLHDSMGGWIAVIWKIHGKPMEGFLGIPWKMHGRFHRFSMECQCHSVELPTHFPWNLSGRSVFSTNSSVQSMSFPWGFGHMNLPWIFHVDSMELWRHGFTMDNPWRIHMAKNPWKTHGFLSRNFHGIFL